MAVTIKYSKLVSNVAGSTAMNITKVNNILTELSKQLLNAIHEGSNIRCRNLFDINYVTTRDLDVEIYNNNVFDFDEQVNAVSLILNYNKTDVSLVISQYYNQIRNLLSSGYQANVKSVAYIEPVLSNGTITYFKRISPVLVNTKPLYADFMVVEQSGDLVVKTLSKDNLRFNLLLSDNLETPYLVKED